MVKLAILVSLVTLAATSCGGKSNPAVCDAAAALQSCAFNPDTQAYDRDCMVTCDFQCPGRTTTRRACQFNSDTQAYDKNCAVVCGADGGS